MSLIDSYDESEEIVRADILTKGQKRLPKTLQSYALKKN